MRERYQVKWRPGWVAVPAALITANLSRNARLCWTILAHQAQTNSPSDMKSLGELLADGDKPAPDRKTIRTWIDELEQARWLTRYRTVNGNEYELHEPSAAPPLPDPDPEPQPPTADQPQPPAAGAAAEPDEPTEDDITWQVFHDELLKLDVKAAHKLQLVPIPNRTQALKHVQAMAAAGARGGAIFNWVKGEGHKPISVASSQSFIERYKHMFERDQPMLDGPESPEPTPTPTPQRTRAPRTTKPSLDGILNPAFVGHVHIGTWPTDDKPYCLLVFSSDRAKEEFRPYATTLKDWIGQVTGVTAFTTEAIVN